jgi:ubiquinone/menaquinone biosynthesis C-methylase UbiE
VGETFLDWLDAPKGLRWLDVGCGNGQNHSFVERTADLTSNGAG